MFRATLIALALFVLTGCGPGIRFKPGEIPTPTATDPSYIQQAEQMHQHMVANVAILRDPAAERRVSNILSKLFDATPTTGHWTVTLIDESAFNAMTAPGNYVFVFRGLLDAVPNDDEVAMVLAHEIGHRLAQHELDTSEEKWGKAIAALAPCECSLSTSALETEGEKVQKKTSATKPRGRAACTLGRRCHSKE